ncbi:pyridoxal phosphate-dependent aminotransferase [Pantoea sp. A4]|uniref:pyridoxal phosphate-dependent aminotransferase n=1 Tax=Pantoea sp. A4 TaxID=1225184 RepID=UPI00036F4CEC|nr:pyridoxal phosphate-dependent aminotransferase [Pantoea sp. A4]
MDILSDAVKRIHPSASNTASQLARELREQGKDVIALSAGEPDFDTPEHIKQAAIVAMQQGQTKYPPVAGIPALREAIKTRLLRDYQLHYESNEIIVSNGAKQVIANALLASLNPGDEVIIPAPYWVSYPDMVAMCGGTPVTVQGQESDGFKLTAAVLERAITPRTKWLMFNSPSNPTGAVYTQDELQALTAVLHRHPQVWIITDDIYDNLIYDDGIAVTLPQVDAALKSRILLVNGVSKSYAMTGWRVGYGAGPAVLINAMLKLQGQTTSGVCSIAQWAAVAALSGQQAFLNDWRESFRTRRNFVADQLNAAPGLRCLVPQGAFYVYCCCEGLIGKSTPDGQMIRKDKDFTDALLHAEGVAVVHGEAFGLAPYFRVSYAASMAELAEACARIQRFCVSLS